MVRRARRDSREARGMRKGRRERIEKGSRERISRERENDKDNMKRRRAWETSPCLEFSRCFFKSSGYDKLELKHQNLDQAYRMHYLKNMSWYETECKKYVPLVKQNVMKLEVFILGGQRIDQKRKKGWWRGRRERIEKGSRERIEKERKETKGNWVNNLKRRIRNIVTCLCLLFSFPKALRFSWAPD